MDQQQSSTNIWLNDELSTVHGSCNQVSISMDKYAINATGMITEITLFKSLRHRINSNGWMMKWRWREGVERDANPNTLRECWTFLIHIFPHQLRKQLSRISRCQTQEKFEDVLLVLTIKTVIPVGFFWSYFCMQKQAGNHCNWHKSFKERASQKFSIVYPLWMRRKHTQFWSHWHCCQKPQPLCKHKEGWKERREKEEWPCPPLIMQIYNARGRGGGWVKREGGGGGGSFAPRLYMSQVICSKMTICETHKPCWKRKLTYCALNPGNSGNPLKWGLTDYQQPFSPLPHVQGLLLICPLLITFPLLTGTRSCRGVS